MPATCQTTPQEDKPDFREFESTPRPVFVYGTLCANRLLAWVLTGDASNADVVSQLVRPARVAGFSRFAVRDADYPAAIKDDNTSATVNGNLVEIQAVSQRRRLDDFEGDLYTAVPVCVSLLDDSGNPRGETISADMYIWNEHEDCLSTEPWDLDVFIAERLEDWLDLFDGMELTGEETISQVA